MPQGVLLFGVMEMATLCISYKYTLNELCKQDQVFPTVFYSGGFTVELGSTPADTQEAQELREPG